MPQIINTNSFDDFVSNMTIRWRKSYMDFPKRAAQLYDVEDVSVDTGDESGLDGFSVAKRKREGEDFAFLQITQNYRKSWQIQETGGMTKITWRMRVANKYRVMNTRISNLGRSTAKRLEWDLTHRFTFGPSTSYTNLDGETISLTVGDGLALFTTAHTVPGSSITFRTRVANNPLLSKGGLEAAEKLFATQMIDTNGELIADEPTHLITTNDPNTVNTAMEYLKSTSDPTQNNQGVVNVYGGKYTLIVLPYLSTTAAGAYDSTKAKYWMLANLNHTDAILKVLQRPTFIPPTKGDGMEFETMDWKFASHAAYAIEIIDPRWIVFSSGDGTA